MNKKSNKIFYFLFSAILALILLTFSEVESTINTNLEYTFKSIHNSAKPDSNIILITIEDSDIEQLGGWPLKRSYYALLINRLNQLNVKAIGLEVFLSDLISSQTVYSDVLLAEIKKSNNIVFGSIVNRMKSDDDIFISDSINYPFVKNYQDVQTGHLSYIKGKSGIILPLIIKKDEISENAFSLSLANIYKDFSYDKNHININFLNSWISYRKYSLIEFFKLFENDKSELSGFQNKIILVGITAQSLAKNLSSSYDNELPGIGFHAIALDNILNNNFYNDSLFSVSSVILFFMAFIPIFFHRNQILISLIIFGFVFLTAFLSYNYFQFYLNLSAFILPFGINLFMFMILFVISRNEETETAVREKEDINKVLTEKTSQLKKLENELELGSNISSNELLDKVAQLKYEVIELRNRSRDEEVVEPIDIKGEANFHGIIYKSKEMSEVVSTIKKVASENATVLILGESGSGKELVAKAIHKLSKRNSNNFVAINCAALSESLLESELFGYVKGSFTNALNDKNGLFEEANNGTIFLDEIGETSEAFQTKLLRVLQSGEIQKVGSTKTINIDARIIAATNKNLKNLVDEKKFREDLFYRLNVIQIKIPPLRERKEDIKFIANFILKKENSEFTLSKAVLDILNENEWKGNVRELESALKHAMIYAKSESRNIIQINDLPSELAKIKKTNLDDVIIDLLSSKNFSHSSINEAASELNLSRTSVSENLRGYLFKSYVNSNFDLPFAIISLTNDFDSSEKLKSKLETYLSNIQRDLEKLNSKDFDFIKTQFSSKYKNLPQKYHLYLDEIIKHFLANN